MELAKEIGADAIYAHREVSHDGAFKKGDSIFFLFKEVKNKLFFVRLFCRTICSKFLMFL